MNEKKYSIIRYVAFGTDCFCRFKFQPVCNAEEFSTLPAETVLSTGDKLPGGLIGYAIGIKNGNPSNRAWDNSFELMSDHGDEKMFSFKLKKGAKILQLKHLNELNIIEHYAHRISLNFNYLSAHYDAVYIEQQHIEWNDRGIFNGWEIHDTILVMNPGVVISKKLNL